MIKLFGYCWKCHIELEESDFGRQNTCPKCRYDTHACKACVYFDRSYNNSCKETQADRVVDKEKSNFCDYFSPSKQKPAAIGGSPIDPKAAAEALFKKKG